MAFDFGKIKSHKSEYIALCAVMFAAAALRLAYAWSDLPTRDSVQYILVAKSVCGKGFWSEFIEVFSPTMPPLLHLFLGGVAKLGGDPYHWGLALMIAADIGFIGALYLCGKKLFPLYRHAGIYTAIFAATTPELISVGSNILRDNLYLCIFAVAVYCGICMNNADKIRPGEAICYGVCCTAGLLCRKEAIELPLIFFLWALWMFIRRHAGFKYTVINALIVFGTFAAATAIVFGILRMYYPAMPMILTHVHLA